VSPFDSLTVTNVLAYLSLFSVVLCEAFKIDKHRTCFMMNVAYEKNGYVLPVSIKELKTPLARK
jgi:hypothetical protein